MEDRIILKGLIENNPIVLEYLYNEMFPHIEHYVLKTGGERDDARDLFQEALLVLYNKALNEDLMLTTSIKDFLIVIVRNLWIKEQRRSEKQELELVSTEFQGFTSEKEAQRVKIELIKKAMNKIPVQCKKILENLFEDKSNREISNELGFSYGYFRKQKGACLKRLVKEIKILSGEEKVN